MTIGTCDGFEPLLCPKALPLISLFLLCWGVYIIWKSIVLIYFITCFYQPIFGSRPVS